MSKRVERIVLVGRTADVWPVAALLARELPEHIALHVVEDNAHRGSQGATVPLSSDYHTRIGIDCADLLAQTDAALSLGSVLENFGGQGASLVTAPSGKLPMVGGVALHQIVSRLAAESGGKIDFAQGFAPFRFAARGAEERKMALPSDAPDSPLAMLGPQVSFGRADYAAMLRAQCGERCVITEGRVIAIEQDEGGAITSIALDSGGVIFGDFFVDCTGDLSATAGLQDDLMPLPTAPLGKSAIAELSADTSAKMPVYRALDEGLLAITPTANGQYVTFGCSSQTSDETIHQIMGEGAAVTPTNNSSTDTPWRGNLARLGPASAQIGPMLSADMALLQAQALLLVDCLPVRATMQAEAAAFNRKHAEALLGITDFAFAPFHLASCGGQPWQDLRSTPPSNSLQTRIDQFRSRGRVPVFERDHADEQTWIELLAEMGVQPARYDRRADAIPAAQAARILGTIRQQLDASLAQMETTAQFLRRFDQ